MTHNIRHFRSGDLFILYWAMLSFITPPVAIGAYAAASIARCSPMRAGVEAMRFGAVKYVLPFFFVYNPALVAQHASWLVILLVSAAALLGVGLIAYALQGYLLGVGPLASNTGGYVVRAILGVSGVMLAAPEPVTDLVGFVLFALTYAVLLGAAPVRHALLAPRPTSQ